MAVAELPEPGSLGRVVVDENGKFMRIVEARDASPEELAVRRINAGIYALPAPESSITCGACGPTTPRGRST